MRNAHSFVTPFEIHKNGNITYRYSEHTHRKTRKHSEAHQTHMSLPANIEWRCDVDPTKKIMKEMILHTQIPLLDSMQYPIILIYTFIYVSLLSRRIDTYPASSATMTKESKKTSQFLPVLFFSLSFALSLSLSLRKLKPNYSGMKMASLPWYNWSLTRVIRTMEEEVPKYTYTYT